MDRSLQYRMESWEQLSVSAAGMLIDKCLFNPVSVAILLSISYFTLYSMKSSLKGLTMGVFIKTVIIFFITAIVLIMAIPTLHLATDRVIFRPHPTCTIFYNPCRYVCAILGDYGNQRNYVTEWQNCSKADPRINEAEQFYIVSTWIPSPDHFRTKNRVWFVPDGNRSKGYWLSSDYCVRASSAVIKDQYYRVTFYSLNGTELILQDTGLMETAVLEPFYFGWYLISNCRTELHRWIWSSACKIGYVSTKYIRLPQYSRILLLEDSSKEKEKEKNLCTELN